MTSFLPGIRYAQLGFLVNALLVVVKFLAGIIGNSSALIADALESTADIFSSLVVWSGLRVASKPADENHPYGHGKAESLATAIVALLLIGAALSITIVAVRDILTPHQSPAPFTLFVVAGVVLIKEVLYRRVFTAADEISSDSLKADAWHHRSDAITSLAAFIGISVALWGGPGWEAADDWAALVAVPLISVKGFQFLRSSVRDLMDHVPDNEIVSEIEKTALSVDGVLATEKLRVRKLGAGYLVDLHVQADPELNLREAHIVSGKVKTAIQGALPQVEEVLIHIEPYEGPNI